MAQKRKVQEAFGRPKAQLSAAAALKQARHAAPTPPAEVDIESRSRLEEAHDLATAIAGAPYDGLDDSDGVEVPETRVRPSISLSTWRPSRQNVLQDDAEVFEIKLKANESATFVGEFDLRVVGGLVSISGATLHQESGTQRVYALPVQALPTITARKASHIILATIPSIACLEKYSPLFRNISTTDSKGRSFAFLVSSADDPMQRTLFPLEIEDDTKNVISRLVAKATGNGQPPRIMAVGTKSSGKSTFNRILCNAITTWPDRPKLFYLDLDPGQPEFGPPGQISLVEVTAPMLGPPLTHPASSRSRRYRLIRSHTIAATSFKDDPDHYTSCVADLTRRIPKDAVVVVNACGWVNGLGATVLSTIASAIAATDVILMSAIERDLEEVLRARSTVHTLPRKPARLVTRSPADHRAMQTMAYFHQKYNASSEIEWIDRAVRATRPWEVSYAQESGIMAFLSYGQAPHSDYLAEVLDGSVVAIAVLYDDYDLDSIQHTSKELLPYSSMNALDPRRSRCIGLGLIRGIDIEEKEIHLVTPLAEEEVASISHHRTVLVRGSFDSPEWAYLEDIYASEQDLVDDDEERPWVSVRGNQTGIEGSIWRLRHPPTRDQIR